MLSNFPKWVETSAYKYFNTLESADLKMYAEPMLPETILDKDYFTVNVNQLECLTPSKGVHIYTVFITVLISSVVDDEDRLRLSHNAGVVANAFTDFVVYKYGDGIEDDGSKVCCFNLDDDGYTLIYLRQVSKDIKLRNALITGYFETIMED